MSTNNARKGFERRYAIESLPGRIEKLPYSKIEQIYTAPNTKIRKILRDDKPSFLLIKDKGLGLISLQEQHVIDERRYKNLSRGANTGIKKRRYQIELEPHTVRIDAFNSQLKGLVIAIVKSPTYELSLNYKLPAWFGARFEITNNDKYSGRSLATNGLKSLRRKDIIIGA